MFVPYVLIFAILMFFGRYLWARRKLYLFGAKVPGPFGLPIVGNGLKFFCKKEDLWDMFASTVSKYPSPMRFWLGPQLLLVVSDPKHLQILLQSSKITTKAFFYKFLEPFLGNGILTTSGPNHKVHKKLLQPLFSPKMVEVYSNLFTNHANKFVERLKVYADGPEFDINLHLNDLAFETSMDLLIEDKNDHFIDYKDIPKYVRRFYDIFFDRVRNFLLHFDVIYQNSSLYKEQRKMLELTAKYIDEVMDRRLPKILEKLLKMHRKSKDMKTPSILQYVVEMVIENPDCLSIQDCTDHLMTFMATSQDTQSTIVAFTCMMLGAYPRIQDLAFKELKEILSGKRILEWADASKLKYLESISISIKESMRLFPIAPVVFRETTEEFHLGQLTVPKNVIIGASFFHVHRDPNQWERPNEYYPEHFRPEATNIRHPFAFLPFSAGPRKCVAQQFSITNMKILVGTILLNYEFECSKKVEDIGLMTDVSIRPTCGYLIKLKKRV